jgi:hypothetical protein
MAIAEVKFIVSDKKLFAALKALEGLALQPPVVHVPEGITTKPNGLGPKKTPDGITGIIRKYVKYQKSKGHKTVTTGELKKEAVAHGYDNSSYSYALTKMVAAKEIKKGKNPGTYEVLNGWIS